MLISKEDCYFRAQTYQAYTIKSLIEVLQNLLTDVCFTIDKKGIKLLTIDDKTPSRILLNLFLNNENFNEYHYEHSDKCLNVGVNLQHLYRLIKSVKKKDNLLIFISKDEPDYLGLTIKQQDSQQSVTSRVKIQKLNSIDCLIPDCYYHPFTFPTSTYQKMCKDMQNLMTESIKITSKDNEYISFSCSMNCIYHKEIIIGEKNSNTEDNYEDEFHTKSLSQLTKVSGINSVMQIHTPKNNNIPIKIKLRVGHLGNVDIFLKSKRQINNI